MDKEIQALLQEAISQAEISHEFYRDLAASMDQRETRDIFQYLAGNELQHKTFLERWLAGEVCPVTPPVSDFHLSEFIGAASPHPKTVPQGSPGLGHQAQGGFL